MNRLRIDIETRSRVDLRKTGVYRYVRCPDFKILLASWSLDGENVHTFEYPKLGDLADLGVYDVRVTKVAHNAQFERICFSQFLGVQGGYLSPEDWHCTQAVAGELGYPQSLAKLAPALGVQEKDEAGTRLINLFSKPNRQGGWNDHTTHPMEWLEFIAYCEQDVSTLIDVDRALGDFPTETERRVFFVDQYINDRGIAVDVDLARAAVAVGEANEAEQVARVRELTGVENPNSVVQLTEWAGLPDLKAATVESALATETDPVRREVLELRQELALAAPKKFSTALESHVDGRLHGTLKFAGAHTLRWAGRGTQVQNLPREGFTDEDEQAAAILDVKSGFGATALTLKRLVRPLFVGPFTVVDYRSVEAIVLAWLSGETWVLEAFLAGRDLYVETAERMGGLTRAQGKIAVLALGFNGSVGSLRAMGAEGSDEELYPLVHSWRQANPNTVQLWTKIERAFRSGGPAGDHLFVEKDGSDRLLRLPSGRAICYRKCGIRDGRLTFWSPKGYRTETYGGKLSENATQAVARDLLAEALVRLEERGYHPVAHTHDEILVEGEHDVDEIAKIMCEPPGWAVGLPIDGEGFVCERYKKG